MNILIFLIILLVLVLVHEFGHFFSAKKFGIRVDEFGFGFPPKIFGFKKGETEYTLNLLPLGGFVKIFGENPEVEQAHYGAGPDEDRKFYNKPKWKQAIVLFAGVFANFILAWFLFSFGFMSGFPTSVGSEAKGYALSDVHLVVISVASKSPSEMSGLKSGDIITSVGVGKDFTSYVSPETVKSFVVHSEGDKIEIGYTRGNNAEQFVKITPDISSGEPLIGISMDQVGIAKLPFLRAFYEGMNLTLNMIKGTALGLYGLITDGIQGKGSFASITGPVGMVGIVGDAYELGIVYLLSFAALISVNLAVINLLPFPALDGGRLLFLLIEKIKGSRMNPKFANTANMVGFGILILLMLVVTYRDVVKLF
ncbi:MAG: site-2 protease family protein [Candidatus Parcubacteria bacterium]|nr:site-2 protease family protein [Candidatus Parcubacteria bacterium]